MKMTVNDFVNSAMPGPSRLIYRLKGSQAETVLRLLGFGLLLAFLIATIAPFAGEPGWTFERWATIALVTVPGLVLVYLALRVINTNGVMQAVDRYLERRDIDLESLADALPPSHFAKQPLSRFFYQFFPVCGSGKLDEKVDRHIIPEIVADARFDLLELFLENKERAARTPSSAILGIIEYEGAHKNTVSLQRRVAIDIQQENGVTRASDSDVDLTKVAAITAAINTVSSSCVSSSSNNGPGCSGS